MNKQYFTEKEILEDISEYSTIIQSLNNEDKDKINPQEWLLEKMNAFQLSSGKYIIIQH